MLVNNNISWCLSPKVKVQREITTAANVVLGWTDNTVDSVVCVGEGYITFIDRKIIGSKLSWWLECTPGDVWLYSVTRSWRQEDYIWWYKAVFKNKKLMIHLLIYACRGLDKSLVYSWLWILMRNFEMNLTSVIGCRELVFILLKILHGLCWHLWNELLIWRGMSYFTSAIFDNVEFSEY